MANKKRGKWRRSWPTSWDELPAQQSPEEAMRHVEESPARLDRMLSRIRALVSEAKFRDAKRASHRLLASDSAKLAVIRKLAQRREVDLSAKELVALARSSSVWRPTDEPALLKPIERSDGTCRATIIQPWLDEAMGRLAMLVERANSPTSPYRLSGSTTKTMGVFGEHLPKSELVLTVDVPKCFDSHDQAAIESSSILPGRVLRARAFDVMLKVKALDSLSLGVSLSDVSIIVQNGLAGVGIPSGAALSAVLSEQQIRMIGKAVEEAAPGVRFFHQSDNLIMFLPSASDRSIVEQALVSSVKNLFAEGTSAKLFERIAVYSAKQAILFCGVYYRLKDGKISRRVDQSRIDNKVDRLLNEAGDAEKLEDLAAVERKAKGWFRSTPKGQPETNGFGVIMEHIGELRAILKDVPVKS